MTVNVSKQFLEEDFLGETGTWKLEGDMNFHRTIFAIFRYLFLMLPVLLGFSCSSTKFIHYTGNTPELESDQSPSNEIVGIMAERTVSQKARIYSKSKRRTIWSGEATVGRWGFGLGATIGIGGSALRKTVAKLFETVPVLYKESQGS